MKHKVKPVGKKQEKVVAEKVDLALEEASRLTLNQIEKVKPTPFKWRLGYTIGIVTLVLISLTFIWFNWFARSFAKTATVPLRPIIDAVNAGIKINPFEKKEIFNLLILGLDQVMNQRESSNLTDTMMMVSINKNGRVTLISLPRDLWIDALKTKINSLYYYGEESEATTGMELVATMMEEITGVKVDGTIILRLGTVQKVIDVLGGVMVDVPKGFTDTEFPRDNVDITQSDPEILYETVTFNPGLQSMDGATALKYIRSRHSTDIAEGNDVSRVKRQQQVVLAITNNLKKPTTWFNPNRLGALYLIYQNEVKTNLQLEDFVGLTWAIKQTPLTFITTQIPIETEETMGIIRHPAIEKYKLWVYEPVDPTWQELRQWVKEQMEQ